MAVDLITSSKKRFRARRLRFAALLLVFIAIGAFAAFNIIITRMNYAASRDEYEGLRRYVPQIVSEDVSNPPAESAEQPDQSAPIEPLYALSEINPDFIGWIRIEGTNIDYPIVWGVDNVKYLNTTFTGERNASGAVFMDIKSTDGFDGYAVIYGHNMRDGSMFQNLHRYREVIFHREHREVIIILPDGEKLLYRIFEVRETDIHDKAFELLDEDNNTVYEYFSSLGVMNGSEILVLSTCTSSRNNNERLLVLAEKQSGEGW